jgi:hypothetical protein
MSSKTKALLYGKSISSLSFNQRKVDEQFKADITKLNEYKTQFNG